MNYNFDCVNYLSQQQMDLTVCRRYATAHRKTRTGSFTSRSGCLGKIDCSDITFDFKNPLFCLSSKAEPTPLTPRRSILEVSEVKRIAEQSSSKSKLKRVKSKLVATINLHTKNPNCYDVDPQKRDSSNSKSRRVIKRSISIAESLQSYEKITPVDSTPKSSFNILKEIGLREQNQSQYSESGSMVKHKVIRSSINYQEGPKRCIKIMTVSKRPQQNEHILEGMYYTFSPYKDQNLKASRF